MLMMCYLVSTWPFDSFYLNWLELINEMMVLLMIYLLYIFSGLISDPEVNYEIAGYLTVVLYTSLVFNLIVAIYVAVKQIFYERELAAKAARKLEIYNA